MRLSPALVRSRMRGARTATGPRPVMIARSGRWPWRTLAAVFGLSVGMAAEEGGDLGLDGLRQQGSRALAQNFGERVGELCWLDQLDDSILAHGVSLLRWRSGGSNTPTIRRLNPSRRHQLPRIPPCRSRSACSGMRSLRGSGSARRGGALAHQVLARADHPDGPA